MNDIDCLKLEQFPRSSRYHPDWIAASASGGANALWLTEWLTPSLGLQAGMKVLDLGCGRAASSVFLAREFDVRVWATDLWFNPAENQRRIEDAGVADRVTAIRSDARSLPYPTDFFDVIVAVDSYAYFGTDEHYLAYLARFVKPGGVVAIAGAGHMREIEGAVPEHLKKWWTLEPGMWSLHSAQWWSQLWQRTGLVQVELADTMPDGWLRWLDWHRLIAPDNALEIAALEEDGGDYLGYMRVVSRRRPDVVLNEPIVALPANYQQKPLLRDGI